MCYIKLGYPLDELLNGECLNKPDAGGIKLPESNDPGTGNIVIRGRPGTGKSTLAMEIAVASTRPENGYIAVYVSLEQPVRHVLHRAKMFNWDNCLRPVRQLHDLAASPSPNDLGGLLLSIINQPGNCPFMGGDDPVCDPTHIDDENSANPCVLVPSVSPRSLNNDGLEGDMLFWERYKQLEHMLEAATWLSENKPRAPKVKLVCIDSLNVFGDKQLSREELFRIFDLFRRYRTIGVCVAEDGDDYIDSQEKNTVEYLADMVISLGAYEDEAFSLRCLEITKSRYQPQVHGKHPFKMKSLAYEAAYGGR